MARATNVPASLESELALLLLLGEELDGSGHLVRHDGKSEGTGGVECVCMQGEDDKLAKKAK